MLLTTTFQQLTPPSPRYSLEVDALVIHRGALPAAVVRGETSDLKVGLDERQVALLYEVANGLVGAPNAGEKQNDKECGSEGEEGGGVETSWGIELSVSEVWKRRQELCWEARRLQR